MRTRRTKWMGALAGMLCFGAGGLSAAELQQTTNLFNVINGDGIPTNGVITVDLSFVSAVIFSASQPWSMGPENGTPVPTNLAGGNFRLGATRVGAPFFGRSTTFLFGQVINPPNHDRVQAAFTGGVTPESYWESRPFEQSDILGYEWNASRRKVIALRDSASGEFKVVWRVEAPETSQPAGTEGTDYISEDGVFYRLRSFTYAGVVKKGSTLAPPATDVDSNAFAGGVTADKYWAARPHNLREAQRYYYSPSARLVFATQPGQVTVRWRTQAPIVTNGLVDGSDFISDAVGNHFGLFLTNYVISGAPVKPPRSIFWTGPADQGIPVLPPQSRLSGVKIVHNSDFPEVVPSGEGEAVNGETGIVVENNPVDLSVRKTLFYSENDKTIQARNREGRVFMELQGDLDAASGSPSHLGFEIINVVRRPIPKSASAELGEPVLLRRLNGDPNGELLTARVANSSDGNKFIHRHFVTGTSEPVLYAKRKTEHVNDIVLWWMETGEQGILWPSEYVQYAFDWPTDEASYTHYVRPLATSQIEARKTAVALPTANAPTLEFQDDPENPRAHIDNDFKFYTRLDESFPAHRSLLRFNSGDFIRWERVFSWLDTRLVTNAPASFNPRVNSLRNGVTPGFNSLNGAWDIQAEGDTAYVISEVSDSFSVIDLSDPATPVLKYEDVDDGSKNLDRPWALDVHNGKAYVAAFQDDAIRIYNVASDPPVFERELVDGPSFPEFNGPTGVAATDDYLYVASLGDHALVVVDLRTTPPTRKGATADSTLLAKPYAVAVSDNEEYAFMACLDADTFAVIAVTNKAVPVIAALVKDGDVGFDYLDQVYDVVVGKIGGREYAFVSSNTEDAVTVIDVTNPTTPAFVSVIRDGVNGFDHIDTPGRLKLSGNRLFIPGRGDHALTIADVSDPANPRLLTSFVRDNNQLADLLAPYAVAVGNQKAYVAAQASDAVLTLGLQDLYYVEGLETPFFANTVATNLPGYQPGLHTIRWQDPDVSPRVVAATNLVGQRITAPAGELGSGANDSYLAGYIHYQTSGDRPRGDVFLPEAYIDPFAEGFEAANQGAIIPVNAIPGDDVLEVQWFRDNGVDQTIGFKPMYWPSVIGRYTLRYPEESDTAEYHEIILASNDGTGPLSSLLAKGSIYYKNERTEIGYNPNEEHALMLGGQGFALRDDLNVTQTQNSGTYTSEPYVLLSYTGSDGRPAMRTYKVLREKGNITFNFKVEAGTVLQAPMPLPLLDKPVFYQQTEQRFVSLNKETADQDIQASASELLVLAPHTETAEKVTLTTPNWHSHGSGSMLYLHSPTGDSPADMGYFVTDADVNQRTVTGFVSDEYHVEIEAFGLQTYFTNTPANPEEPTKILRIEDSQSVVAEEDRYEYKLPTGFDTTDIAKDDIVLVGVNLTDTEFVWSPVKVLEVIKSGDPRIDFYTADANNLPRLLVEFPSTVSGDSEIKAKFLKDPGGRRFRLLTNPKPGGTYAINHFVNWRLDSNPGRPAVSESNGDDSDIEEDRYTFEDRKNDLWVYRGEIGSEERPEFSIQWYYNTLEGFYFPKEETGLPPVGTATPYLTRKTEPRKTRGDSNGDGQADGNALPVTYRPYWPEEVPTLYMAETLTLPKRGLPAMRGHTSLQILVDQSKFRITDPQPSVALHDPTREKVYPLGTPIEGGQPLDILPGSIKTSVYQGKTYFPNLPPHLADRLFFDPNRGTKGALVLSGQFIDAPVGEDYVMLNLLTPEDKVFLESESFIAADDPQRQKWVAVVADGLTTTLELFVPSANQPGTFQPSLFRNVSVGPTNLAEINNDDIAVDSYALTATGPGTGYVTLVAGNGRAFTPEDEPVSLHVIKVVKTLHRGELKIVESSNPLSEKVSFQQVVDLAGKTDDYGFEWKIAAPVDGAPPPVFLNTPVTLSGAGKTWRHLRHPLSRDRHSEPTESARVIADVRENVAAISTIPFTVVVTNENDTRLTFTAAGHALVKGNAVVLRNAANETVNGVVVMDPGTDSFVVNPDWKAAGNPANFRVATLNEQRVGGQPQSILYGEFTTTAGTEYTELWLSLSLDDALGAKVYLNNHLVAAKNAGDGIEDIPTSSPPGTIQALPHAWRLETGPIWNNTSHRIRVELFSQALPETPQNFDLRVDALVGVDQTQLAGTQWLDFSDHEKLRAVLGGTADIRTLSDNYVIMRYKATNTTHASFDSGGGGWSQWTEPQLAEGWIKRVLKGINPFNQRVTDLFANRVDTDASLLTQAGQRWEGNVALNLDSINDFGLIEIYETVLNRGKDLSIDAGINYGPANDALLLAAGYINDLYMMIGNEAWADASNPTIGIGTADQTYGDIATALFAFKGQMPNLLEEELALLRGRDDFIQPGIETAPAYNRLFWNYTRGINSGEVIYALNYNITEDEDDGVDGTIDADDARKMFPQGHGDAYGHYLTATKSYYKLLLDPDFTWVPRTEAVTVLGKPVQVDYQDERKFAAAAAATARVGRQIFDLTWRKDFKPNKGQGWEHLGTNRVNATRNTTRYWGADHWAARTYQGAYFNWVAGNAMLPEVDPDPTHEGILKIDRTTVPELKELVVVAEELQTSLDNAEAGLNPLGLPEDAIAMDINPALVLGSGGQTHFEQIYDRATKALNNATVAFDDAKDVTRLMRSEEDSLSELQTKVAREELAFTHQLIELYGTPYTDDIGPGKTYAQGYAGPDLHHFTYVDNVELDYGAEDWLNPKLDYEFEIDIEDNPFGDSFDQMIKDNNLESNPENITNLINLATFVEQRDPHETITLKFGSHGFFGKPADWTGRRASPGELQTRISDVILAVNALHESVEQFNALKGQLDREVEMFYQQFVTGNDTTELQRKKLLLQTAADAIAGGFEIADRAGELAIDVAKDTADTATEGTPKSTIFGMAGGGDLFVGLRAIFGASATISKGVVRGSRMASFIGQKAFEAASREEDRWFDFSEIDPLNFKHEIREGLQGLDGTFGDVQLAQFKLNQKLQAHDQAWRNYRAALAKGDRIQAEREIFRQRSAAVVQGFRTRDAAFRLFRNEKLERYKTLFDLSAKYAFLAAQAYDYETGLLGTQEGRNFIGRIISSRALGVVQDGEPHFAGSNTGDPGLSSALAEMKADWDVLKGRLGFNNPDTYGTRFSLRQENYRLLPNGEGDIAWKDILEAGRTDNLLQDDDVRRLALNIDSGNGLPVPGIVIEFGTTIEKGRNFFGRPLAGGDHNFSAANFATKIFSVGVALEGYQGMDDPGANSSAVNQAGGSSPSDPTASFLDPLTLAATPEVYLIPVGVDFMRSPPLGDQNVLRSWDVQDVTIPLPFNIGASDFSSKLLWQSRESLTEELFGLRKHQPFRPVSSTSVFPQNVAWGSSIASSQFTNSRLIGRSVWNTQWKLIIPGYALLNDPEEGLDRFIQTVKDIKIHLATYSYSGN